jgi:hypothetical protein
MMQVNDSLALQLLYPKEEFSDTHLIGDRIGLRVGLKVVENKKITASARNQSKSGFLKVKSFCMHEKFCKR